MYEQPDTMTAPRQEEDPFAVRSAAAGEFSTNNSPIDRMPEERPPVIPASPNKLDSEPMQRLWRKLMGHYVHELAIQQENRAQMAEDEAFYDGEQWGYEEAMTLAERGQEAIVYNVICTTLNWLFGTERRTRTDYKILPRREDGSKAAARKSELMKYLADANRTEFSVSKAFQDASRAGLGWLEGGWQDEDEGEPVYERYERWRNMLHDSAAVEDDLSDARYIFRHKWIDADLARAYFPNRDAVIDAAVHNGDDLAAGFDFLGDDAMDEQEQFADGDGFRETNEWDMRRDRLRMFEAWFKKPTVVPRMSGGDFSGEIFDPSSRGHQDDLMTGRASVRQATAMKVFVMVFTSAGPVYFSESPYRHNKYPFTPVWGFKTGGTNQPYGVVRNLKGMQRDINKRASKALAIMSANRVIMDEGAVADMDEFEDEIGRPNAIIVKRTGKALDIDADRGLDNAHLDMMSRTIAMIQSTSGITDENLGRQTNASSGKAILARQDQGSLATSILFDNLRLARQIHGEKTLSLVEQFMTEEKTFRITNTRGTPSWVRVNDGLPENDIAKTKADYIISEDSWDATLRQSKANELLEMIQALAPVAPQIVMVTLDLLLESLDVPNGEELVKRVRQMTGQIDPDADLQNPDEDTAAALEAQKAQAEKAARMEAAQLAKIEAEAAEKASRAEKTRVDAEKVLATLTGDDLATKQKALELALAMLTDRPAIPVADRLLAEAGMNFGAPAAAPAAPPPAAQAVPAQPAPMPV